MERKGCIRFATTTEAEIEEKRLKLNAERTIKQNKAAAAILKDYVFQNHPVSLHQNSSNSISIFF
jgi:hypothetical protein